jgi:hypothetical protein
LDAIATAIRDKAKAGTHFGNYTDPSQMPNPIWKALLKDENDHNVWDVDCYRAAAIVVEALRLLGIPGVGAETVYATTDLNLTAVEEQACSNHETVYLRYATEYPPRSVNDPTGGYLNQFQGCFIITVDENFHYYSVYPPIGPFANPNGRLKVLHGLQDYYGANQFGQWWSYDVKDGQGKTIDRLKDLDEQHGSEVPLPAIP